MSDSLKQQSMRGIIWSFLNRSSIQVVQFVVSLVLARLLCPEDYGVVGLAFIVISMIECISNLRMGDALVQKKHIDELDYNTSFWTGFVMSLMIYAVIFFMAPVFARFYNKTELTAIIRVISTTMLIGLPCSVSTSILSRRLDFKTTAWIGAVSCIVSGTTALVLAFIGFGVWALVAQNVISEIVRMLLMVWRVPWCPRFQFSWERFRFFLNFGYKLTLTGILENIYNNITGLIIGKAFSVQALGFYSKGDHLPNMAMNSVNTPILTVSFPVFSKLQEDPIRFRAALRKTLRTSVFYVAPIMTGLVIIAKPLILLLYGEKWLPAVPFLRIMAICYIFHPIITLNKSSIMSLGRTDWLLILEIVNKICGFVLIFSFVHLGLILFVCSKLISTLLGIFINTFPLKRLINYSSWRQLGDIVKSLSGSFCLFFILFPMNYLPWNPFIIMGIQIPLGIVFYLSFAWIVDRQILLENTMLVKKFFNKHKQ